MRVAPPGLPGNTEAESPADRALALLLAGERDAALRWVGALLKHDPTMPTALCLAGRLLGELGRQEVAREALQAAVTRAIDHENLTLAVAAARELERLGGAWTKELDTIAAAFSKESTRLGPGAAPPPPLPPAHEFQPLPSVLTGALLLSKATELVHEATRALRAEATRPTLAPKPVFSAIGRAGLRALIEEFVCHWVAPGGVVIQQGAPGDSAFFVARGELEVRRNRGEDEITLGRLLSGAIFGEMAVLSRAPRTGSVVATRPAIVLEVASRALDKIAVSHPEVGSQLAEYCKERMVQNLVRMSDVLRVVPPEDRPALISRFRPRTFEKGLRLHAQGQKPEGLFLIASGEVAVVRVDDRGEPLVLSTLGPGDVVGEVSTVLRRLANADVIATHPTVTLFLPVGDFLGLVDDHPSILAQLYRLAVRRDEETESILSEEASAVEDIDLV